MIRVRSLEHPAVEGPVCAENPEENGLMQLIALLQLTRASTNFTRQEQISDERQGTDALGLWTSSQPSPAQESLD